MTVLQTIAVAFAMFSAVPVPQFDWNEKNMRYSLCAFPLVGVLCGALWYVPIPAMPFAAMVIPRKSSISSRTRTAARSP